MFSTNTLVLTFWPHKEALIQSYTLPYVKIMRKYLASDKKIWLQTLEKSGSDKDGAFAKTLSAEGINWLPEYYSGYGLMSMLRNLFQLVYLVWFCYRHNIGVIHVWCTPPGVKGYLLSKLTGARLILDSYEPHAEAMVENGTWKRSSMRFRILFFFEKLMSKRASVIVSATKGMEQYAKEKYNATFRNFFVKPACVNLSLFDIEKGKNETLLSNLGLQNKTVMLYAGKFGGIYLDKEVFELARAAHTYYGEHFRFLLLTSHKREEIDAYCNNAGLDPALVISRFVSHSEIPEYMALADFAITPVKPVPTKRYCTPIKDGEYWALGLPVIITKDISDDSEIIEQESAGVILRTFDAGSCENAIRNIDALLNGNRQQLREKIRKIAEKYRSFDIAEKAYSKIYF